MTGKEECGVVVGRRRSIWCFGDVQKVRAVCCLAEVPPHHVVTHLAVSHFSLDHVFSRRTIPWKLLEKAKRENPRILLLAHTKMLTSGIHILCEGVNWEEEEF